MSSSSSVYAERGCAWVKRLNRAIRDDNTNEAIRIAHAALDGDGPHWKAESDVMWTVMRFDSEAALVANLVDEWTNTKQQYADDADDDDDADCFSTHYIFDDAIVREDGCRTLVICSHASAVDAARKALGL